MKATKRNVINCAGHTYDLARDGSIVDCDNWANLPRLVRLGLMTRRVVRGATRYYPTRRLSA